MLGCGGTDAGASDPINETGPIADSASPDTARADSGTSDSNIVSDSGGPDSAGSDSSLSDSGGPDSTGSDSSTPGASDAGKDASPADTSDAVADACGYVDVNDVVVKCGDKYTMLGYFDVVPSSATCPPYWAFAGKSGYATKEEAIAAAGCSASCIYQFSTSVTRLYCSKKTGYEVLKAGKGCADLYRFAEGYFDSVAAHDAAFPCP